MKCRRKSIIRILVNKGLLVVYRSGHACMPVKLLQHLNGDLSLKTGGLFFPFAGLH